MTKDQLKAHLLTIVDQYLRDDGRIYPEEIPGRIALEIGHSLRMGFAKQEAPLVAAYVTEASAQPQAMSKVRELRELGEWAQKQGQVVILSFDR